MFRGQQLEDDGEYPPAFTLVDVDVNADFVHVLDDVSVYLILAERDTAPEFIEYLNARERAIRSGSLIGATGEDDILGWYLKTYEPGIGRRFKIKADEKLFIMEGQYADLVSRPEYQQGKRADRVSYLIDDLIERLAAQPIATVVGTDLVANDGDPEEVLRKLAEEPRVSRRGLAESLLDQAKRIPIGKHGRRVLLPQDRSGRAYVSVMMHEVDVEGHDYRAVRRTILSAYAQVVMNEYPTLKEVIGIGTEAGALAGKSVDLIYLDATDRPEGFEADAEFFKKVLRSFDKRTMTVHRQRTSEYPAVKQRTVKTGPEPVHRHGRQDKADRRAQRKGDRARRRQNRRRN